MKTRTLIWYFVINLFLTSQASGQASFDLRNRYTVYGINAPVFDALGMPLAGTNYAAELWGGASPGSLVPAVEVSRENIRIIVPFGTGGYFSSSAAFLSVPAESGGFAWLQIRAWDARLGSTYESVTTLGIGGYGNSPLFYARGSDPNREPPEPPAPLIGLQSFSLLPVVPEPGTGVLVLLGFGCLAARRWFNRRDHSP